MALSEISKEVYASLLDIRCGKAKTLKCRKVLYGNKNCVVRSKWPCKEVEEFCNIIAPLFDVTLTRIPFLCWSPLEFSWFAFVECGKLFASGSLLDALVEIGCPQEIAETVNFAFHSLRADPLRKFYKLAKNLSLPWSPNTLVLLEKRRLDFEKGQIKNEIGERLDHYFPIEQLRALVGFFGSDVVNLDDIPKFNNIFENRLIRSGTVPQLDGTACTGKSTVLSHVSETLRNWNPACGNIVKTTHIGSFKSKDVSQTMSLQYQLVSALTQENPESGNVMDRSLVTNLVWRMIMKLFADPLSDLQEAALTQILELCPRLIELLSRCPVHILLARDVRQNIQMMLRRNEGRDAQRAREWCYCRAQNIIYGTIASLCGWPIYLAPLTTQDFQELCGRMISVAAKNACYGQDPPRLCGLQKFVPPHVTDDLSLLARANYLGMLK